MALELVAITFHASARLWSMAEQSTENVQQIRTLVDRVKSIEAPLRSLQDELERQRLEKDKIAGYEAVLQRINSVLAGIETFITKYGQKSKFGKFIKGARVNADYEDLSQQLDSCINDLQMAVLADELASKDERMADAAELTSQRVLEKQLQLDTSEQFTCVQCGATYQEARNGEGACCYHTAGHNGRQYECCGKRYDPPRVYELPAPFVRGQPPPQRKEIPGAREALARYTVEGCQRGRHHAQHHNEHSYEKYHEWISEVVFTKGKAANGGVTFKELEDADFDGGYRKAATVGTVDGGTLLYVYLAYPKFLATYTVAQLKAAGVAGKGKGAVRVLVKEIHDNKSVSGAESVARAELEVDGSGYVRSLLLTCQSSTSSSPEQWRVGITTAGNKFAAGALECLSRGGLKEAVPTTPYTLKPHVTLGDAYAPHYAGFKRHDLPTVGALASKVRIKVADFSCNNDSSCVGEDRFTFDVSIVNISATEDVTLFDLGVKLHQTGATGADAWLPAFKLVVDEASPFKMPCKLEKGGVRHLKFTARFDDATMEAYNIGWYYSAWKARFSPVVLAVTLESTLGEHAYTLIEFGNKRKSTWDKRSECAHMALVYDAYSTTTFDVQFGIKDVKTSDGGDGGDGTVHSFVAMAYQSGSGRGYTLDQLRKAVVRAQKTGVTEQNLGDDELEKLVVSQQPKDAKPREGYRRLTASMVKNKEVFALVDLACERVYCIKVVFETMSGASTFYHAVPMYAREGVKLADVARVPPKPAVESYVGEPLGKYNDVVMAMIDVKRIAALRAAGAAYTKTGKLVVHGAPVAESGMATPSTVIRAAGGGGGGGDGSGVSAADLAPLLSKLGDMEAVLRNKALEAKVDAIHAAVTAAGAGGGGNGGSSASERRLAALEADSKALRADVDAIKAATAATAVNVENMLKLMQGRDDLWGNGGLVSPRTSLSVPAKMTIGEKKQAKK